MRAKSSSFAVVLGLVAILALPSLATAAEGGITVVVLDQLRPGQDGAWIAAVTEIYGPVLNQGMADGNVLGWGMAERASGGSDHTHAAWVIYPSWDAMAAVDQQFAAKFMAMSAEDQAAIGARFGAIAEPHQAQFRYLHVEVSEVNPEAPMRYLMVSDWDAAAGKAGSVKALYEKVRPAFAQAMADGAISGYGLYSQELHDGGPSHTSWYALADFSGIPKVDAALDAAMTDEVQAEAAEVFDMSSHRDTLYRILYLGSPPAGDGEAEPSE
jgi:hypothetical protein